MVWAMVTAAPQPGASIREYSGLDDEAIRREVIGAERPAVLRGHVRHWPIVAASSESPAAVARYLGRFDQGTPVDAVLMPPEVNGEIFYNEAMSGFNFVRNR